MNPTIKQNFKKNNKGIDFVVGDIHGEYDKLMSELDFHGFDKSHDRLFSVGDLVDRGPESLKCLELMYEDWFIPLQGNHEDMLVNGMEGKDVQMWLMNGGHWSIGMQDVLINYIDDIKALPHVIELETEKGKIGLVHANVGCNDWDGIQNVDIMTLIWSRGMFNQREFTSMRVENIDYVVAGHSPVGAAQRYGNVFFIDSGSVFDMSPLYIIPVKDLYDEDKFKNWSSV